MNKIVKQAIKVEALAEMLMKEYSTLNIMMHDKDEEHFTELLELDYQERGELSKYVRAIKAMTQQIQEEA